jgi:lipopolysaccharide transport protein LptA
VSFGTDSRARAMLAALAALATLTTLTAGAQQAQNAQDSAAFAVTPAPPCADPLCYSADSLAGSRTHMVMINPDIVDTTRGISHVTADRAEENGADVGDSDWVLTGHVRADMSSGQLRADRATIHMADKRIASITANGAPAQFQRPSGPSATGAAAVSVHGHANTIIYDAVHDQVQFTGDSWFSDGCNDINSQLVTYDITRQTVQANEAPGGSGRVHGTIRSTRPGSSTGCTLDNSRS